MITHPLYTRKKKKKCLNSQNKELISVGRFLNNHGLCQFPYDFYFEYEKLNVEIEVDEAGYSFINHKGKRLYGKENWSKDIFWGYYIGILREQDTRHLIAILISRKGFLMKRI